MNSYYNEKGSIKLLTLEEERELGVKTFAGDKAAKDELVRRNLKFAISVANKYQTSKIPFEDLINEGNIGLIEASDTFNPH